MLYSDMIVQTITVDQPRCKV